MPIKVVSFTDDEGRTTVFQDGAALDDLDRAKLTEWAFTNQPRSALLARRAADRIVEMGLTCDERGFYNPQAYALAEATAYCATHALGWTKNGVADVTTVTMDDVEALPDGVLMAYFNRSKGNADRSQAKKQEPPSGGEGVKSN